MFNQGNTICITRHLFRTIKSHLYDLLMVEQVDKSWHVPAENLAGDTGSELGWWIWLFWSCKFCEMGAQYQFLCISVRYYSFYCSKVCPIENNTHLHSLFCLLKVQKLILFFHLHFTWLCGSWHHQRIFKKYPFWKNDSSFFTEVSKFTSAEYP